MLCYSYCRNFHSHLWPDDITKWKVLSYFIYNARCTYLLQVALCSLHVVWAHKLDCLTICPNSAFGRLKLDLPKTDRLGLVLMAPVICWGDHFLGLFYFPFILFSPLFLCHLLFLFSLPKLSCYGISGKLWVPAACTGCPLKLGRVSRPCTCDVVSTTCLSIVGLREWTERWRVAMTAKSHVNTEVYPWQV